ncbi:response regulator [Cytophagaceae bacterium YF14B1]|uniref:Response regulator n=1 Tax=Xanthocytophaga flava TaxID=3048013 RepID=A0AAE3QQC2_9BACT|nr:response regulator [Xanthocytophaga flavus]MDJ1480939.1 response regulator [Xanthocytophaga flavus]
MHTILIVDDDPEDKFLLQIAFKENQIANPLVFLSDGLELIQYLEQSQDADLPLYIMLDLNMPRMNGREALMKLKSDTSWSAIPLLIYTTSANISEICECYRLGANCYLIKPSDYEELIRLVAQNHAFWSQAAVLCEELTVTSK